MDWVLCFLQLILILECGEKKLQSLKDVKTTTTANKIKNQQKRFYLKNKIL